MLIYIVKKLNEILNKQKSAKLWPKKNKKILNK